MEKEYSNPITPFDLRLKDLLRKYFKEKFLEAQQIPGMRGGLTIREEYLEQVIDELWIFINKNIDKKDGHNNG